MRRNDHFSRDTAWRGDHEGEEERRAAVALGDGQVLAVNLHVLPERSWQVSELRSAVARNLVPTSTPHVETTGNARILRASHLHIQHTSRSDGEGEACFWQMQSHECMCVLIVHLQIEKNNGRRWICQSVRRRSACQLREVYKRIIDCPLTMISAPS